MENGVERVGGPQLGEENNVENQVSGEKVEERVVVGTDKLKDFEEEIFEEAVDSSEGIDSQGQFQDQGENSESVLSVETMGDSSSLVVEENSNMENEVETFEEAVDAPVEAGVPQDLVAVAGEESSKDLVAVAGEESSKDLVAVAGEESPKDLVGGDSVDKIDEGGTSKEVIFHELNGEKEVSEIGGDVGTGALMSALEVNSRHEVGRSREILSEDGKVDELKKDELGTEYQNMGEYVDGVIQLQEDNGDGLNDNMKMVDTECHQGEKSGELNGDTTVLASENGVPKSEQWMDNSSNFDIGLNGGSSEDVKDISVPLNSGHHEEIHDLNANPAVLHAMETTAAPEILNLHSENLVNDGSEDIRDCIATPATLVEEDNKVSKSPCADEKVNGAGNDSIVIEEPEKKAEKDHEEKKSTQGNDEQQIPTPEKLALSSDEKFNSVGNDSNVIEEPKMKGEKDQEEKKSTQGNDKQQIPTPEKLASSTDEKFNNVGEDSNVIEEPKKKEEKDHEEKKSTQGNGERQIPTPEKVASSSETSTGPAPTPVRPAGLGRAAPLLEPAPRAVQQQQQQQRVNGTMSHVQSQQVEDLANGEGDEYDETCEKLQMIRVKFLRLAHRLGQTPHNVVVAQVLYRLGLAEQLRGRNGGRVGALSFDRASAMAEQLEAAGQEPLDFSCTIMVLGKTGVGKSATINSIFDEVKFGTDAFQLGTKKVQDVVGTVQGIKVRVIDTPGLLPSGSDQRQNEKILNSVKHFIKQTPPDIVLYLDRLDMQSRDFGDMPLLRTITEIFGPSIWFNAIVVLTHAASAPPDGPNGTASSYDMFVTQRSHVVQQAIRQAAGDMRLMNPVSLVENHSACRTNRAGQRVLPNGQVWKPHLLLLSFASKILAEANTLLKLQDSPPGKPFATRSRAPPLPFLLSSLLQSRQQVKLPEEQLGDEDGLDDDLEESSDSEDESEYDDLPPFKSLTKAQVAKLTRAQKKAYFDELEYREKLFMKKQLKEEKKRQKMMKKMAAEAKDLPSDYSENVEEESAGAASVPVPIPDLALPASFDSDNPTHRYRYLDTSNQWLVRPVLETHGWDHDVGYEGINAERLFVVKDKIPLSFSGQVTKDKKDANVQMELASCIKHGDGKSTSLGFDMQTVGKDLSYTLRSETKFCNYRKNKATAGLSVTLLGDAVSAGLKVEDKLIVNKRFQMVLSGGAMTGRCDVAYGGSLEAQLRDKDYPLGRSLSTLGLSVMDWHGDLAVGCNIQSQLPIGRSTNLIARGNLNNRGAGQISIRINSSEQLQIALVGLLPLLKKLFDYPQQMQYGQ